MKRALYDWYWEQSKYAPYSKPEIKWHTHPHHAPFGVAAKLEWCRRMMGRAMAYHGAVA